MGRWIYDFFFNTDMRMRTYVVRSGVVSLVPSMIIAVILGTTGLMTEENAPELDMGDPVIYPMGPSLSSRAAIWLGEGGLGGGGFWWRLVSTPFRISFLGWRW